MKALLLCWLFASAEIEAPATYDVQYVDPQHVEVLLKEAVRLSKYPMPDKFPEVAILKPEDYDKETMGHRASLGFFAPYRPQYITLNSAMHPSMYDTVIVHELTHFLQWKAGLLPEKDASCDLLRWIEQEAFVVSYRFELDRGGPTHGMVAVTFKCGTEIPVPTP